jgi:hypothetical protein
MGFVCVLYGAFICSVCVCNICVYSFVVHVMCLCTFCIYLNVCIQYVWSVFVSCECVCVCVCVCVCLEGSGQGGLPGDVVVRASLHSGADLEDTFPAGGGYQWRKVRRSGGRHGR